MTRYTHARHGERCTRCNDLAARVVGTQPLCVDHFGALIEPITKRVRWRILTPHDDHQHWRQLLEHGVTIGAIAPDEARTAWNNARKPAA